MIILRGDYYDNSYHYTRMVTKSTVNFIAKLHAFGFTGNLIGHILLYFIFIA